MSPAPIITPCSTTSFAWALETPKNLAHPLRLRPFHTSANGCGAHAMDRREERNHLVKTAPKVPDLLEEEWRDDPCYQLVRIPRCRLRIRPSKEDVTSTKTSTLKVPFVPAAAPTGKLHTRVVPEQIWLPLPSRLPSCLMFPDIPSSYSGGRGKFILKPKPLSRSFQPSALEGSSH
jgi:hypothetical protein